MRYLLPDLLQTLQKDGKMAFLVGPRQVGKTTLAKYLLEQSPLDSAKDGYFNWDIDSVRKRILKKPEDFWKPEEGPAAQRIVLDEIHKYPRWKRFLKGFYDANRGKVEVIVT